MRVLGRLSFDLSEGVFGEFDIRTLRNEAFTAFGATAFQDGTAILGSCFG